MVIFARLLPVVVVFLVLWLVRDLFRASRQWWSENGGEARKLFAWLWVERRDRLMALLTLVLAIVVLGLGMLLGWMQGG